MNRVYHPNEPTPDRLSIAKIQDHLEQRLRRIWECDMPKHTFCIPMVDGQHHRLSKKDFANWVEALCLGTASMVQPPDTVLPMTACNAPQKRLDVLPAHRILGAVPSDDNLSTGSPIFAASASPRAGHNPLSSSAISSGVLGPGYLSGKALKWIGEKTLHAVEEVVIFKRAFHHLERLKRWDKCLPKGSNINQLGSKQLNKLARILEDAEEMSRPCYSGLVNLRAERIYSRVDDLLLPVCLVPTIADDGIDPENTDDLFAPAPLVPTIPEDIYPKNTEGSGSFRDRQKEYLVERLAQMWKCDCPGHIACATLEGRHQPLSQKDFEVWVEAIFARDATVIDLPEGLLSEMSDGNTSTREATSAPRTLSAASSRSRNIGFTTLAATASLLESTRESSASSRPSSGVLGPGYYSGRALKWLGETSLNALEEVVIATRTYQHQYRLKRWKNKGVSEFGVDQQNMLVKIIKDALEMSRSCYSRRVNTYAASIGWEVHLWINTSSLPLMNETDSWLRMIGVCLPPLVGDHPLDPSVCDVASELLKAFTRIPLALQGPETTSSVIRILARELAYSPYIPHASWLGANLLRIVETTSKQRLLTSVELEVIRDVAARRSEIGVDEAHGSCRPWELALFAECASQDPWFTQVVLGEHGLSTFTRALHEILSFGIIEQDEQWLHLAGILSALVALSRHAWFTHAVEAGLVKQLIYIMRQHVPEQWFRLHFWIIFAIRNIVNHQPMMLRTLVLVDAAPALEHLMSAPMPRGATHMEQSDRKRARNSAREPLQEINDWLFRSKTALDSRPYSELRSPSNVESH